jgi:ATP-dependent Zn protease
VAKEITKNKPHELDKSIDVGMDQFGRFVKYRWLWLIISGIIGWYFIFNILPQLSIPAPGTLFMYLLQIMFAIFYVVIQFVALFWFMGRPRLYWVMPGETGLGFKDYKGNPEVLEAAKRMVTILRGNEEFREMGGVPIRGLLLSGPPGTGKSYLAQCISTEAEVPFAYASAASFRGMFWGMDVLMVKNLYRKARRYAREYGACVVFIDEFDAVGMSRTGGDSTSTMRGMGGGMFGMGGGNGALNELLMQMDPPPIEGGWFKKILRVIGLLHSRVQLQPVLTIGATNIPQSLDPALLRPGRFDRKIHIAPPTDKYRPEVIEYYLKKVKHDPNISISALSQRMVDYTPVKIKHVINEGVIAAHFDGRDIVTYKDLVEAQDIHEYGLRQQSELTDVDRRRLAYHEAGHTVASHYLMERAFPAFVTIQPRGDMEGAAGFLHPRPKETIITQSKEDILASIQMTLAARASEEIFLNVNLNGVTSDLAQATTLAERYVCVWGMDGTLTSSITDGLTPRAVPNQTDRIENLLQAQFKTVKKLLKDHSEALITIAEALIERDELLAEEIKQLIEEADARQVTRKMMSEFEPLSAASESNGKHGYASTNGKSNSTRDIV